MSEIKLSKRNFARNQLIQTGTEKQKSETFTGTAEHITKLVVRFLVKAVHYALLTKSINRLCNNGIKLKCVLYYSINI